MQADLYILHDVKGCVDSGISGCSARQDLLEAEKVLQDIPKICGSHHYLIIKEDCRKSFEASAQLTESPPIVMKSPRLVRETETSSHVNKRVRFQDSHTICAPSGWVMECTDMPCHPAFESHCSGCFDF